MIKSIKPILYELWDDMLIDRTGYHKVAKAVEETELLGILNKSMVGIDDVLSDNRFFISLFEANLQVFKVSTEDDIFRTYTNLFLSIFSEIVDAYSNLPIGETTINEAIANLNFDTWRPEYTLGVIWLLNVIQIDEEA